MENIAKQSTAVLQPLLSRCLPVCLATILLAAPAHAWTPNVEELSLAKKLQGSRQNRPFLVMNAILSKVARERAVDMVKRRYFAHVNPDGKAANWLVTRAGYPLPASYRQHERTNTIESIAAGYRSVEGAWHGLLESRSHRQHLLAETDFFAQQTSYGIGYCYDVASRERPYWVILTAPAPRPSLSSRSVDRGALFNGGMLGSRPLSARDFGWGMAIAR